MGRHGSWWFIIGDGVIKLNHTTERRDNGKLLIISLMALKCMWGMGEL